MQNLWIVIPTYNECDNIAENLARLFKLNLSLNVLVVDDNSPDGTGELVDELSRFYKGKLFVLHRPGKLGLGSAYRQGFAYCLGRGAQVVGEMDADLSHQPKYLPKFLEAAKTHDLVLGSRYIPGGGVENWNLFRPGG